MCFFLSFSAPSSFLTLKNEASHLFTLFFHCVAFANPIKYERDAIFCHRHQLWCWCVCFFFCLSLSLHSMHACVYQSKIKCNWFYFDTSFNHSSEKITKVAYFKVINVHLTVRSPRIVYSRDFANNGLIGGTSVSFRNFFWHEFCFLMLFSTIRTQSGSRRDEKKWSSELKQFNFRWAFSGLTTRSQRNNKSNKM